jgi:hypothetical protein
MKIVFVELSPDDPQATDARCQQLIEFWNELRTCGDSGATTWEVLESLERQVTECLDDCPPDIGRAESVTALAALLMMGQGDL